MSQQYKLPYKIKDKYSQELENIRYFLNNIEQGHIYGLNGNRSKSDASLQTNCAKLKNEISSLLLKIQNGSNSIKDDLCEIFTK